MAATAADTAAAPLATDLSIAHSRENNAAPLRPLHGPSPPPPDKLIDALLTERRRRTILLRNVPEARQEAASKRQQQDEEAVVAILDLMRIQVRPLAVYRVGKSGDKPRFLLA